MPPTAHHTSLIQTHAFRSYAPAMQDMLQLYTFQIELPSRVLDRKRRYGPALYIHPQCQMPEHRFIQNYNADFIFMLCNACCSSGTCLVTRCV